MDEATGCELSGKQAGSFYLVGIKSVSFSTKNSKGELQ
jgi:hypothetical protein